MTCLVTFSTSFHDLRFRVAVRIAFSWICEGLILGSALIAAATRSVGQLLTNFVLHVCLPKWKICAFFSDMYAVHFLVGQTTASSSAPHSSQILEELSFSLFLSSNYKMNRQFGFGQRNDPLQPLILTVWYPLHFVFESFFHGRPSSYLLSKSVRLDPFME